MDFDFKEKETKAVAYKDNTIAIEKLPLPIVLYPGHNGTFFGFKEDKDSPTFFCYCGKEAIENHVRLQAIHPVFIQTSKYHKTFILFSGDFPKLFIDILRKQSPPNDISIVDHFLFDKKLCHECNNTIPNYKYCVDMYGGTFKQNFGWYINKKTYEFGIDKSSLIILRDRCPQEILDLIILDPVETPRLYRELILMAPQKLTLPLPPKVGRQPGTKPVG